jgi:CubicO group peptidase (beta-lactamase class C family)
MLRRTFLSSVALALRKDRMEEATRILDAASKSGKVTASSLYVRQGSETHSVAFGKATPQTPFLLASITKPMTATAIMALAGDKQLTLEDPVQKFIPEFKGGDRGLITIRHILTHTSGLPDMLPENEALRKKHAPLEEFVAQTCKTPLLFKPGTRTQYQSMGILLAAEIAERITRTPFRDFLRTRVFEPLGMRQTALGLGHHKIPETAQCQVPEDTDWHWNSPYWRNLGAPWGGAHSTAEEVARLLEYFLQPDDRVIARAAAASMIVDQNRGLKSWGIGWMVGRRFAKRCSARSFGHSGSTGTSSWADPASGTIFVLLTTKPAVQYKASVLQPVAEAVAKGAA